MRDRDQTSNEPNSSVNATLMEDVHQQVFDMATQLRELQEQLVLSQQQIAVLSHNQANFQTRSERKEEELPEGLREYVAAHPQQPRLLPDDERKKLLRGIPTYTGVEAVTDKNGLATKGMQPKEKKWVTKDLVNVQKDNTDIIRVAAAALVTLENNQPDCVERIQEALIAVARLAGDNLQKAAAMQLQLCLDHTKATGSEYLIKFENNEDKFSYEDRNIFQQAHLDAVKEFNRFATQVEKAKETPKKFTQKQRFPSRTGYGGTRTNYQSFRGNSGFGGGRSRGGGRGGGGFRGGGFQPRQQSNQESKNSQ